MKLNDTIAAVSTPRGKGGIAVIRISGAEAIEMADSIFVPACGKKLAELPPSKAAYGNIYHNSRRNSAPIDNGIATIFRAPRSFTGEDTVEISCHGGLLVTEAVLSAVLSAGARHAEAGEFTRRAFVNGKMALSETEALSNLLEAKNLSQMKLARSGLEGKIERECSSIYNELRLILASLYAKIDYPDEELADLSNDEMSQKTAAALQRLKKISATYKSGHAIAEGIKTVICGKPNVGKSSLYNRIVGRDAAIVTDVEGTTRDILEETATLGGVTLRLCDTAGLRDSSDLVEQIGIERAREKIEEAELILAVFDGSSELDGEDRELIELLGDKKEKAVAIINKCELERRADKKYIEEALGEVIEISAKDENGIAPLAAAAEARFLDKDLDIERDAIVFGARQHAALTKAEAHLLSSLEILSLGGETDAAAFETESAMAALSELDGKQVSEDIVSEIFSHFCVGK